MKLTTETTEKSYTVRGSAKEVVGHVEGQSPDMAHIIIGAMTTMAANKEKEAIIDFESSEVIDDDRPFEVVVHQDQEGDAAKFEFEFRFLDEEESHG